MRKRIGLTAGVLAGALALGAPAAQAAIPTSIIHDADGQSESNANFTGHLDSTKTKCVIDRKVKVYFFYLGTPTLVDEGRSTQTGAFVGEGRPFNEGQPITGYRIMVSAKKIGPRNHRKTCAAAQQEFGA